MGVANAVDGKNSTAFKADTGRAKRLTEAGKRARTTGQFNGDVMHRLLLMHRRMAQQPNFFTAWPAKGATKPMQVTLEILQNNRLIGKTSGELPAADERGQKRRPISRKCPRMS